MPSLRSKKIPGTLSNEEVIDILTLKTGLGCTEKDILCKELLDARGQIETLKEKNKELQGTIENMECDVAFWKEKTEGKIKNNG